MPWTWPARRVFRLVWWILCTVTLMALPITVWEFNRSGFDTHHQAWFVGGIFVMMAIPISVYEAYVIYNFFAYLMAYLEEEYGDVEAYCLTKPDLAPMPVVGRFLKPQPMGPQFLWGCKKGVLNYVILRPLCTIIALIASRYGVYGQGQIDPYKAYIYLAAVTNISQLWALLCLVNFYNAMHEELAPIRPLSKFITIKAIVFMTFWQGIVITLLVSVGVIQRDPWDPRFDATDVASGIQDFLICIEMFIAALAQAYAFPPRDYMADDSAGEPQPGFMKNVRHMFDLRDVAEDVGDVLGDHVEHVSSAAHTVISVPGKAVKGIVQGPANLMNLFNGAGSGSSKRPSSKHRLLPEDDEEGVSSSSSSSRATSLVATARAGSTHELLEHDTTRQHPSRSSQHQGTPAAAASARPHGGSSGSGPRAGVALSTFAGPSGGSYAAAVAGASGAGDPGVGLSGGGGGRRRASSSTGGVAGGGAHGSPGHPLPAAGGGGPFGGLSSEQSGASFGSILSSDSRREPFIPVNDGDEEDQGAGRRGPGDEFSAAGAVSSDGGGGATAAALTQQWRTVLLAPPLLLQSQTCLPHNQDARHPVSVDTQSGSSSSSSREISSAWPYQACSRSTGVTNSASPHAHHIVSTSSSSLSGHSSSPHGGAPHPHADQGLHTASIHYQPRHHPASLLRHQPSGAGAASQRRHHPHHDQHVRPLHTHPGAATDTRMATPHRNAHTQPSSSAAPSGSQPGESQDGEVAPAHGLEDAEGAAGPVMPAHAAAYLPAKQATGRDDGREALSQKERYVDKVSGGQGPGLRGGYQDTLWWEKLWGRPGDAGVGREARGVRSAGPVCLGQTPDPAPLHRGAHMTVAQCGLVPSPEALVYVVGSHHQREHSGAHAADTRSWGGLMTEAAHLQGLPPPVQPGLGCRNAMLIAVAAVTFSAVAAVGAASSRHGLRSTPHAAEPHTLPAWCVWPPPRRCGSVPGGAPAGTGACAMSRRGEVSRPCAALHVRHTSACEHAHPQGRRHKALAGVLCALCGGAAPASTQPTARRLALGHRALTGSAKGSLAPGHRALTGSAKGSLAPGHRALSGSAKGSLAPGHRALSGSAKGSLAPGHRALTGSAKGSLASSHRALTGSAKGSLAPGHRALTGSAKGSLACAECTPATGRGRVRERDSQEERPTAGGRDLCVAAPRTHDSASASVHTPQHPPPSIPSERERAPHAVWDTHSSSVLVRWRNLVAVGGTGAAGGAIVRAPRGGKGGRNGRSGHVGPDRIIEVPLGTVVRLLPPRSAEDEEAEEEEDRRRRGEVQGVDVDADSDDDEDEGEVVGDAGSRIRHMGRGPLDIQGPPRGRSESKGNRGMPAYSPANERQRAAAAAAPMGDPILGSDGESEEEEGGTGGGRRVLHRVWGQRARKQAEARLLHEAQQAWLEQQKLEREAVFGDLDDEQEWRQRQRQQRQQQLQQDKSWRGSNDEKEWRRQEQLSLQGGMGSDSDPAPETGTGPAQAGHSGEVRLFDEFGTQGVGDETAATETRRGRQRQRRPSSAAAEEEIEVEGPVLVAQSTAEAETSGPASPAVDRSDLPPLPDWRYGPGSGSGSGSGGGSGKHSASRGGGSSEGGRKKRGAAKQRAGSDQAALDSMDEKEWLAMTKTHRQADHVEEDRETTGAASPTGSRTSRSSGSSSFSGGPSGLFSSFQRPAGDDASAGEQGKDAGWGWQPGGTTSGAAGAMDPGPSASGSRGSESDPESAGRPSLRYRAGAGGIEVVGVGGGLEGAVNSELDRKAAARAERRRVREEAAVEIADLSIDGQRLVLAAGGSGGRGNMALPNPGPNRAASSCKELGEGGALVEVILESKSLADVGFVGMPNAGKSTLLAALTAARAQIGSYAFTTLRPQVGALHFEDDDSLLLLADIPGLLGGAHANVGRGNAFLRHVERTRCLAYIVDLSGGSAPSSLLQLTASQQLAVLQDEVTRYRAFLSDLPALVIANKVDATPNPLAALAALKASTLLPIVPVSGVSGVGLPRLKAALRMVAGKAPLPAAAVGARSAATVGGPQRFTVNDAKAGGRQRANSSVNATCVPEIAQSHIPPASASYPTPSPMNPRKRVDPFDPSPRSGYLSWDDYFMAVAFLSSQRSKDPNKQVGACIVSAEQVILGIGYNGFPRGCPDSTLPWAKKSASGDPLDTKYPYVVHAEANALLNKNAASVKGALGCDSPRDTNGNASQRHPAMKIGLSAGNGKAAVAFGGAVAPSAAVAVADPHQPDPCYLASKRLLQLAGVGLRQHRLGWKGPLTAAVTSGSLSATGDLLAQLLLSGGVAGLGGVTVTDKQQQQSSEGAQGTGLDAPASASLVASGTASQKAPYDWTRTARMFGFGCCFYGPYQYYWYNLLDHLMPVKTTLTFLAKVSANQLLLAPLRDKLTNDLIPTLYNGWKFWIPAASLNFYAIPVQSQVLYMSMCGVLWTAYLSHASVTNISGGGSKIAAAVKA
ncbi:MAG: hypothetical protein WDW38_002503 [Sanguina aurantia]